jgi:hypothetical protein
MMKVELLDLASRTPCALGDLCGVVGMTYHHNPIMGLVLRHFMQLMGSLNMHLGRADVFSFGGGVGWGELLLFFSPWSIHAPTMSLGQKW